jgi:hypothetical protein
MAGSILLNPSASGSGDCCCGGDCLDCSPCKIPKKNLAFAWNGPLDSGTSTLIFNGTSIWNTSFHDPAGNLWSISFGCGSSQVQLTVTNPDGACGTGASGLQVSSFTCNPFSFTFVYPDGSLSFACSNQQFEQNYVYTISDPGNPLTPCPPSAGSVEVDMPVSADDAALRAYVAQHGCGGC